MEYTRLTATKPAKPKKVYLIGALKNTAIPDLAITLQAAFPTWTIFDAWYSAGEHADTCWRLHEQQRGRTFKQALTGPHAQCVFNFDKQHLDESDIVVMVCPAGKSGHLELGYSIGKGKVGIVLLDSPDRWDVMLAFASHVVESVEELVTVLQGVK